jgi:hypothetical protein
MLTGDLRQFESFYSRQGSFQLEATVADFGTKADDYVQRYYRQGEDLVALYGFTKKEPVETKNGGVAFKTVITEITHAALLSPATKAFGAPAGWWTSKLGETGPLIAHKYLNALGDGGYGSVVALLQTTRMMPPLQVHGVRARELMRTAKDSLVTPY